jgi:hypothetical protein
MEQDEVQIKGYVTIWQGEGKNKKLIVKRAENHFVDAGLKGLVSALVCKKLSVTTNYIYSWSHTPKIYIGSDVDTVTTHETSALIAPIGNAPGTAPSAISGADLTNPSSGVWRTSYTAVWYAGTVSGTVGELGLYLRPFTMFTAGWEIATGVLITYSSAMVSRLSNANADFSSFVIDPSKSITVQWDIEVSFA